MAVLRERGSRSSAVVVELGAVGRAVALQGAALADGVRALEDPVLPRTETPEDLRLHRLGPGVAQVLFHPCERIGRERDALLDREAQLVVPVDRVGRE